MVSCDPPAKKDGADKSHHDEVTHETDHEAGTHEDADWKWMTEQVADIRILRYKVPGFESLPLAQKELLYYLSEAAISGRDIIYDQNYKHNLYVRYTLENILQTYSGEKSGDNWVAFTTYLKRVWFSNGIHHHYSTKKMPPEFSFAYFTDLVNNSDASGFPLQGEETVADLLTKLEPIIFDPEVDKMRVNKANGVDIIAESANNYYEGVTQKEVEAFYAAKSDPTDKTPVSYGLNSKLVKENGKLVEKVWKVGGMYSKSIEKVVFWIRKAAEVAENAQQKKAFTLLAEYYETGDLKKFDEYSIAWVGETKSDIDVINGFIEVYGDAKGYRGAFESVVQINDPEASKRIAAISQDAQWFEDNSPIMDNHKKAEVKGISARVINVVMESGDASPSTPIGINLPNANWIRAEHGSKSVNLANIVQAFDEASKSSGVLQEFAWNEEEIKLAKDYGSLSDNLHTDMHEVIGHASGKINEGIGTPKETLKSYSSTLEEGRADLVALYYLMDPKLVEIGVMPNLDVGKEQY
ncbi:MAG TPA: dihydrofolate reductase, partial [Bacteroidetes bacterium]|nr:dihydrofolate reductase [Bacteroidota bacterium]